MRTPKKNGVSDPNSELCPVHSALEVIGGKWKGLLIYHMIGGAKRFNELRRLCPEITQRMLTLQLRDLERDGLVHREVYPQVPQKVEYSLTGWGKGLEAAILSIKEWGDAYQEEFSKVQSTLSEAPLHSMFNKKK